VNVHGDMRGTHGAHVSDLGWGPWEVGLDRVLTADPAEWQNLLRGARDPASLPGSATFGPAPPFYSRVDFDGCQAGGAPSGRLQLPGPGDGFPDAAEAHAPHHGPVHVAAAGLLRHRRPCAGRRLRPKRDPRVLAGALRRRHRAQRLRPARLLLRRPLR